MKNLDNVQLIIIGGGPSIQQGTKKGLRAKLKGRFTFGLNYSYHYFNSTAQVFVDKNFYETEFKRLKELPLVLGKCHRFEHVTTNPNLMVFKAGAKYDKTLKKGVYKSSLVGLFALTLGIYLHPKEIFLLGYDYGAKTSNPKLDRFGKIQPDKDKDGKAITHFYQGKIDHRGIGKINYYYSRNRAFNDFDPFVKAPILVYNVSPDSRIPTFSKISYDEFFKRMNKINYNQDALRELIIKKLKPMTI